MNRKLRWVAKGSLASAASPIEPTAAATTDANENRMCEFELSMDGVSAEKTAILLVFATFLPQ